MNFAFFEVFVFKIIFSWLILPPILGFRYYLLTAGVTLRSPLPVVCHSFGVLVILSHQHRGCTTFHPCLWSVSPSGLLFTFTNQ